MSLPGDERYLDAFWYLSTERKWSTGPIPTSVVEEYAFRHDVPADMIASFTRVLRRLDENYLGWVNEQMKREAERAKGKRGFGRFFRKRR